jgi:hypothetical protein
MEKTTLIDKLTPQARIQMNSWPVEKQEKALYWLTQNEYVYETQYNTARWICFYFSIDLDNFYDLFDVQI